MKKVANKLKKSKVEKICKLLEENQMSARKIADETNVHVTTVYRILQRKSYSHISKDFDIDQYNPGEKSHYPKCNHYSDSQIHEACELIELAELSPKEIFQKTGVSIGTITLLSREEIHKDITKFYDFTVYLRKFGRKKNTRKGLIELPHRVRVNEQTIHDICKMLEDGELPITEIARRAGVNYSVPYGIKNYGNHRDISIQYDIENHLSVKENYAPIISRKLGEHEVHEVCRLLEKNLTVLQVHERTRISTSIIYRIKERKAYVSVAKNYNF